MIKKHESRQALPRSEKRVRLTSLVTMKAPWSYLLKFDLMPKGLQKSLTSHFCPSFWLLAFLLINFLIQCNLNFTFILVQGWWLFLLSPFSKANYRVSVSYWSQTFNKHFCHRFSKFFHCFDSIWRELNEFLNILNKTRKYTGKNQ